jgi:aspartate/methionine/tyrosine aminotransferase
MNQLNQQFELIRQSPTVAMADRVNALKAQGHKIIGLQTGDPDFATPPAIVSAAVEAMQSGLTHYGPSQGFLGLRQAAALKLKRDNDVDYDPKTEILMTHGGIHAYYTALQAILNPGEDVLIPDPAWGTHANMVVMLRGNVIRVPALPENGFLPSFEEWEKAVTAQTRILVINYPSNPTGAYPSREYMQKLQEFAAAHDLWVISDEVYENLYFFEHPTCAASFAGAKERTLLVHSLSKTYAMTGWRVGYLAAPAAVIANALKASQNSITCITPFIQKAAEFALSDPFVQQAAAEMRAVYQRRREQVLRLSRELESEKVLVTPPMGAFYYFLDCRPLGRSSLEICEKLLDDVGVGLVPGIAFGQQGEGFLRLTISASDEEVEKGFRKIIAWAEGQ